MAIGDRIAKFMRSMLEQCSCPESRAWLLSRPPEIWSPLVGWCWWWRPAQDQARYRGFQLSLGDDWTWSWGQSFFLVPMSRIRMLELTVHKIRRKHSITDRSNGSCFIGIAAGGRVSIAPQINYDAHQASIWSANLTVRRPDSC